MCARETLFVNVIVHAEVCERGEKGMILALQMGYKLYEIE